MDNINSTVRNAIKKQISKMSKFAFNDFLDSDEDIREFNFEKVNSNDQNSKNADIESMMFKVVQDDFYNDFDDLNDDDEF